MRHLTTVATLLLNLGIASLYAQQPAEEHSRERVIHAKTKAPRMIREAERSFERRRPDSNRGSKICRKLRAGANVCAVVRSCRPALLFSLSVV